MIGRKKRVRKMINMNFGENPMKGNIFYDAGNRIDKVSRYHNLNGGKNSLLDDITWNDLEMEQVFLRINHTNSFIGEQMLFHKLHDLNNIEETRLNKFEQHLSYLSENPEKRLDIETQLHNIGKEESTYYLYEFLQNPDLWKVGNTLFYHLLQGLLAIFLVGAFVSDNSLFVAGLVGVVGCNLMLYLRAKCKYEVYLNSLCEFKHIYDFAKWIKRDSTLCTFFMTDEATQSLKKLYGMSRFIVSMNSRRQSSLAGDTVSLLTDYIWGITLYDVSMHNHIMKIIGNKQKEVQQLLEFAGEIDLEIAILSYRKSVNEWCAPKYISHGVVVEGLGHPLIINPVKNNFMLSDRAMITGTNASGKSTFMKAIAINCILAQTIHTCNAKKMSLKKMYVMTCMSLKDDIISGESYYFREAKYLKRMLDRIEYGEPTLCIIDEILKGTNTKERIAASKAILNYIGQTVSLALVATHDNELTENERYQNYHFKSAIINNDFKFDYRIQEGTSKESNAIALLNKLGYPKCIVDRAKENMNENR